MLTLERNGAVAVVTLSRPPANAFDEELAARLEAAVEEAAGDENVAVLHLRSSQKIFCAGADLALMRSCFSGPGKTEVMLDVVRRMQRLFERIETAPFVSLAEMGGAALGGGLELALACDLRVAAAEAKLGLPEVRLGLIPGAGGTQRLTRLCGEAVAKRLILGAEVVDGAQAERLGIVQWAWPRQELEGRTRDLAQQFAALPRAALAAAKSCIIAQGRTDRDGYAEEIAATRMLYAHPETRRLVEEFLDRSASRPDS